MGKIIPLAVILSVVIVSGVLQETFAQTMPPPFDKNYVHLMWDPAPQSLFNGPTHDPNSQYPLYNTNQIIPDCDEAHDPNDPNFPGECSLQWFPNFVDPLDKKLIKIMVEFGPSTTMGTPTIECWDTNPPGIGNPTVTTTSNPISVDTSQQGVIIWQYECYPNPDWENIFIPYDGPNPTLIDIWTASFDIPVSGVGIPIDKTALFIATFDANPFSILLTLSILGAGAFGVVIYSVRKKSTY